ncbi:probable 6-phosphogluconolactonase 4, chloroplastic [Rhododendron vialii]|uniref:probable 6-phosphogluconolactonase 4, chloroplastic n=1 Tax=Rhododendron vialii TaxID=182163 RepID=UPI00265F3BDB|nr:probable 6-phosphogluconolactonase 4, chloroplastic [Rhododendron vialii]
MASSSCTFTATLRPSLTPPPALHRSPPTLQSVVSNPLACSLRLKTASRIGVNREKPEYRTSSAGHVITTEKAKGKVRVLDSEDYLAVSLAEYTAHLSDKFAKQRGAFTVVLSGGSLIKSLRKLVEAPYIDTVEWSKWHVFWVDERVVPKDHADSNYKLAYDGFLSKVPIPPGNIYSINDALSPEGAADDYETCLKHLVKTNIIDVSQATGLPKFDLMLLGMGPDGHVASLFPRHPLVRADKQWVAFIKDSPKPPPERITFTFPVINSSVNVALVASGAGKAKVVNEALGGDDLSLDARRIEMIKAGKPYVVNVVPSADQSSDLLPVEMVSAEGELTWFLDSEAASDLLTCSYWMFD